MDPSATPPGANPVATVELELRALRRQVERLDARVLKLEGRLVGVPEPPDEAEAPIPIPDVAAPGSWSTQSALLRRIATISFVLVLALVLRTLTDNGVVAEGVGVLLGIAYAALLIAAGWRYLAAGRPGRRVFSLCGVVLMYALVFETNVRFGQLDTLPAYGVLAATLAASALLGLRYRTPVIAEIGAFGAALAAIGMHFPNPAFPLAAAVLVMATLVTAPTANLRRVPWLHTAVFAVHTLFWLLWAAKLNAPLRRGEPLVDELRLAWFLPALTIAFTAWAAVAWARCRRRPTFIWVVLPTANVAIALAAAAAVVVPWLDAARWLGAAALGIGGLHGALGWAMARRGAHACAATLAVAAMAACVPGTWLLTGSPAVALPVASLAALGLAVWSGRLASGALRLTAVVLHVAAVVAAAGVGLFATPPASAWTAAAVGASLAVCAALQYRWSGDVAPADGTLYARLLPGDKLAVALLWAAVGACFGCASVLGWTLLSALPVDVASAHASAQSVLLATLTTILLLLALRSRSRRLLGTAVLVGLVCGAKVFASDFLTLTGVPLVTSVFAFGATAAVGSLILGRWQRAAPDPSAPSTPPPAPGTRRA